MTRAEVEARVRAEGSLVVWVVTERDVLGDPAILGACATETDARLWSSEIAARRPWLVHDVASARVVASEEGVGVGSGLKMHTSMLFDALERGAREPLLDPARLAARRAWVSSRWPSEVEESQVWIDLLADEVVWWGARHEKGDHEFTVRDAIPAFLAHRAPRMSAPSEIVDALVRALSALRSPDADRAPSLAAQRGDLVALSRLLAEGAAIDQRDRLGRTPLAAAWTAGSETVALHLVTSGASIEDAVAWSLGEDARAHALAFALQIALRKRWFALGQALIDRGAPVDVPLPMRAWELACVYGAPAALVIAMQARGAQLSAASAVWQSPQFLAWARRDPALAALSPVPLPPPPAPLPTRVRAPQATKADVAAQERQRALHASIAAGDVAGIDRAVAAGASIDTVASDGQRPLHQVSLAPAEAQAALVAKLCALGAAVDAPDRSGASALAKAVRRGALPAVTALLSAGASPSVRDDGAALVVHAVLADRADILEALLRGGASPSGTDARKRGALELARAKKLAACEALLVAKR